MTKVKFRVKPVFHETAVTLKDGGKKYRIVCVAENPEGLFIKLKGRRRRMMIPWGKVYLMACLMESNRLRSEKAKARKSHNNVKRGR